MRSAAPKPLIHDLTRASAYPPPWDKQGSDAEYRAMVRTARVFIAGVTALPFVYFLLLYKCRVAICTHTPTRLSRGCRFLWAEYKKSYWWFEPIQQLRRLFLTGWVIALFPENTVPNMRLSAALVVTITMIVLALYIDPYKDVSESRMYSAVQIMCALSHRPGPGVLLGSLFRAAHSLILVVLQAPRCLPSWGGHTLVHR